MTDVVLLEVGLGTTAVGLALIAYVRKVKQKARRSLLRTGGLGFSR